MLFIIMPFACMGAGLLIGIQNLPDKAYKVIDKISTVALILLMFVIGGNVGTSKEVISQIGIVGLNCIITCLFAVFGSVFLCLLVEKTVVPLGKYQEMLHEESEENAALAEAEKAGKKSKIDPILIVIIVSVFAGIFICYEWMPPSMTWTLTYGLWISLIVLYTSVGVGMEPQNNGDQKLLAEAPQSELFDYSLGLRSMTQGRGTFEMTFDRYEEVPKQMAEKIIAEHQAAQDA